MPTPFSLSYGDHHVARGRLALESPEDVLAEIERLKEPASFYALNLWERSAGVQARIDREREEAIARGEKPRTDGKRLAEDWVGAQGVAPDFDTPGHTDLTAEARQAINEAIARGDLPVTAGHATFAGMHVLVLYDEVVTDPELHGLLAAHVAAVVLSAYNGVRAADSRLPELVIDPAPLRLTGLLYAPQAKDPKGRKRAFRFARPEHLDLFSVPALIEAMERNEAPEPASSQEPATETPSRSTPNRVPAGQRHRHLAKRAGQLRHLGMETDAIEGALLIEGRTRCEPPMESPEEVAEIRRIARDIGTKPDGEADALLRRAKSLARQLDQAAADGNVGRVSNIAYAAARDLVLHSEDAGSAETPLAWGYLDEIPEEDAALKLRVVDQLVYRGELTLIHGDAKDGKSTAVRAMMPAIVRGEHWWAGLELSGQPLTVVYLTEDPDAVLREQAERLGLGHIPYIRRDNWQLASAEEVADAADTFAREHDADVIVIDTLTFWGRFAEGSEKDSGAMQAAMRAFIRLARDGELRRAVILIHHSKKEGGTDPVLGARGSGALGAAADTVVRISRRDGSRRFLHARGRHVRAGGELLHTVELDEATGRFHRAAPPQGELLSERRLKVLAALDQLAQMHSDRTRFGAKAIRTIAGGKKHHVDAMLEQLVHEGLLDHDSHKGYSRAAVRDAGGDPRPGVTPPGQGPPSAGSREGTGTQGGPGGDPADGSPFAIQVDEEVVARLEAAQTFLRDALAQGPQPVVAIQARGKLRGHRPGELREAAALLDVVETPKRGSSARTWALPDPRDRGASESGPAGGESSTSDTQEAS